ncbi:MAG: rRNA maturation RNAse YbeY, partial [Burkholderiales bacterium]|nr:rRNA maturation RNAse YbeY [Burkholderiales bacterium]
MTRPPLELSLQFADARHRSRLPRHRVARWVRAALAAPAQITVRIVDGDEARALNRSYRGRDYATNVLTFDYERTPRVVADLVLCA